MKRAISPLVDQEAGSTAFLSPAPKRARTLESSPSASVLAPMTPTSFARTTCPSLVTSAGTSHGNSSRNGKLNEKERSKSDWPERLKRRHRGELKKRQLRD